VTSEIHLEYICAEGAMFHPDLVTECEENIPGRAPGKKGLGKDMAACG
jgi:hypothetical protein